MATLTRGGNRLLSLSLLLISITYATYAQTLPVSGQCAVSSVLAQVRSEGVTERMGDIILQCSGSNPGAVFSGNLSVYLPVAITNRLDSNSTNLTHQAMVSVDYGSGFVATGVAGLINNQIVAFNGLNLTVPPSGHLNLKISNIRAAVYLLGPSPTPQSVQALLSFSSPASIQINQP